MGSARILIVEDNHDNMTLIADLLVSLGYDVLQAADGEAGVALAQSEQPNLILMDLSLPKIDGWEATRQLKADPATQKIPIIALTAHAMPGDRERAMDAGCNDYVSKPINLPELMKKLIRYLG